jgi:hypothetical protein
MPPMMALRFSFMFTAGLYSVSRRSAGLLLHCPRPSKPDPVFTR